MSQIFHGERLDMLQRYVPESAANLLLMSPTYANQRMHTNVRWVFRAIEEESVPLDEKG